MQAASSLFRVINDPQRLAELSFTGLLDSPAEEAFDRFTRLASSILNIPVALVSLVDTDRQFFKSYVGLGEPYAQTRETPLTHSFCKHVVETAEPLIIEDARQHDLVRDNQAINDLGVIAYLGIPLITPQGQTLGSFCAIHSEPHIWSGRDVSILRDLAASVMTEIELRLLARQFLDSYHQLRTLELQRDEMAHMLVHDLRNPLTSLLAGMQLITETGPLEDVQKQALSIAQRGGDALLTLITEILDSHKMEAGKVSLTLISVALSEIIEHACEQLTQLASHTNIALHVRCEPALPLIDVDAGKLQRVLINLIANAIQHSATGQSISIVATLNAPARQISIQIQDNGLGIANDQLERIFEKFGAQPSARKVGASTGLGLPFCKMIMEAHGGHIHVESELGRGSTFHLMLPLAAK